MKLMLKGKKCHKFRRVLSSNIRIIPLCFRGADKGGGGAAEATEGGLRTGLFLGP